MDEKLILDECVKLSKAKPETLIEVYKSIKDYSSVLKVATDSNNPREMAHALLALERHFQYVEISLQNNLELYSRESVENLTQAQKEQLRPLAKQKGNLEFLAKTYKNKWVAHAINTRIAKRKAETSYGLVMAHSKGEIKYLESVLKRKLSSEMQFQSKKILTREYEKQIHELTSYYRPGDGGPSIPPSDEEYEEAKQFRQKINQLWKGDDRKSLMAENIKDEELKASSYEEECDISQAKYYYESAMRSAEKNLDVQKAKRLALKITQLKGDKND
jgi:transposase-like protein